MKYRLLGPLEVSAGLDQIEFNSSRQRIVLSMLLLAANRVVPVDRLIEAVWNTEPPTTARSQIQTCISAMRARLTGQRVILTRQPGYQICVDHGDLDIEVFHELSARSQDALALDPEKRVRDLRNALALWRGPVASGVESNLIQAIATELNENYFGVLDECIDAELELGRHHQLVGELTALVKQYPLREHTRYQYALSLYRCGRQAEALDSLQESRAIIAEELGLEPGEELRSLQQAILTDAPGLQQPNSGALTVAGSERRMVPHQLPPAIADFTGRAQLVWEMTTVLSAVTTTKAIDQPPVVSLVGKGGVGKTALAVHVAHTVRGLFPDGQLFIQLQDSDGTAMSVGSLLGRLLRALGVPPDALPETLPERTEMYRTLLAERKMLIILDDACSLSQVMVLIPASPSCAVVLTGRIPLSGLPGVSQYEVDDFDSDTSIELLSRLVGRERVQAEAVAALDLVQLCTGLPLALRIVAAKLQQRRHWRIAEMVRRMADEGRRLDELMLSEIGIRATLGLSYKNLSRDGKRLFARLSLVGTAEFPHWVAAPLLDTDVPEATDLLDILVDARLVEVRLDEDHQPRFRLHALVRIYALECLAIDEALEDRAGALRRLLECFLSLATEAHFRIYGGHFAVRHTAGSLWSLPNDVDLVLDNPMGWLKRERAGLVAAVSQSANAGLTDVCWDLAVTSVTLFEKECQIEDWRETHEIALETTSAAGSRRGEAAVLYSLGILALRERPETAVNYLNRALDLFGEIDDTHGLALTNSMLAFAYRTSGQYDRALTRYEAALAGSREVGDRVCEIDVLTGIAQIKMDQEDFSGIEELLDQALMLCGTISARRVTVQAEYRMSEFLLRVGRPEQAKRWLLSVLESVREDGDHLGEGFALLTLGGVHIRQHRYDLAESSLGAALDLGKRAKASILRMSALLALTGLWLARGEPYRARTVIAEAYVVLGDLGATPLWRARLLALTAEVEDLSGDPDQARACREEALQLVDDTAPALARSLRLSLGESPD